MIPRIHVAAEVRQEDLNWRNELRRYGNWGRGPKPEWNNYAELDKEMNAILRDWDKLVKKLRDFYEADSPRSDIPCGRLAAGIYLVLLAHADRDGSYRAPTYGGRYNAGEVGWHLADVCADLLAGDPSHEIDPRLRGVKRQFETEFFIRLFNRLPQRLLRRMSSMDLHKRLGYYACRTLIKELGDGLSDRDLVTDIGPFFVRKLMRAKRNLNL